MQRRGMCSNWRVLGYPKEGTYGSRDIDYVWATTQFAAPVRERIPGQDRSDHSIPVVDLGNKKAASTAGSVRPLTPLPRRRPLPLSRRAGRPLGETRSGAARAASRLRTP